MSYRVLIIDDEEKVRYSLKRILEEEKYFVDTAKSGALGIEKYKLGNYDIVITDLILGRMNGLEVIEKIKTINEQAIIILITGKGDEDIAANAIKAGAYDYFSKPFNYDEFFKTLRNAKEKIELRNKNIELESQVKNENRFYNLHYKSESMNKVVNMIKKISKIDTSVLITGESGTGKELIAECIHLDSKRASKPFVKINCAAIPENLIESELFGHEKGSFTGANYEKKGKLEIANGGTVFLDEIGDMDIKSQAKLLRFLEEGVVEKVGSVKEIFSDVRIVAATNVNFKKAIDDNKFRLDLYYRLNVFGIAIPPLRERKEDIIFLAEYFFGQKKKDFEIEDMIIPEKVKRALLLNNWPGNIRELKNVIERSIILSEGKELEVSLDNNEESKLVKKLPEEMELKEFLKVKEKEYLEEMYKKFGDNKAEMARRTGVTRKTLYDKLKEYEII